MTASAQTTHIGKQAYAIDKMISKMHYETRPLDDSLSNFIYEGFLESIDPSGFYFRQSDIDQLEVYRYEIDDQIKELKTQLTNSAKRIIVKNILIRRSTLLKVIHLSQKIQR